MRTGRCQCAAVQFEFSGEPTDASFCHCSICRRLSGSALSAFVEVPEETLQISRGVDQVTTYAVTGNLTNSFCRICGSPLYSRHAAFPGCVYLSLGALDDDRGIVPEYHQFTGSRATWHRIGDDLPQFEEWPDD